MAAYSDDPFADFFNDGDYFDSFSSRMGYPIPRHREAIDISTYLSEKTKELIQEAAEKAAAEAQGSSQAQEKAAAPAVKKAEPAPAVKAPAKAPAYGQAAKLEKIEMKIAELEATIKMYEVQMNMPQNQTDADAMMELTREYEAAQAQLDEAYEKWEALSES